MKRRIRDLSRAKKAGFGLALLALLAAAGAIVLPVEGSPDSPKPGTDVLGNRFQNGDGPLAITALPTKPDTSPPTIVVSSPGGGRAYPAWPSGCAGVCGAAADPSGVNRVEVALRQTSGGRYWNGTGFVVSNDPLFNPAALTAGAAAWQLALPLPPDGSYSASVRATDNAGNTTAANRRITVSFSVDTQAPPQPLIVRHPDDVTFDQSADFRFTDAERGVSFRCQLDNNPPAACSSSPTFRNFSESDHVLQVWAVDGAGNQSAPASFSWTIALRKSFGISGDATQQLSPGASVPLDLTLANPYNFAIRVLDVSVAATGTRPCPAGANLTTSALSFSGPVVIPAHSSRSLSALGVPPAQRPQVLLRNLATNQDSCKNAKFTLTYSGTGTKS